MKKKINIPKLVIIQLKKCYIYLKKELKNYVKKIIIKLEPYLKNLINKLPMTI